MSASEHWGHAQAMRVVPQAGATGQSSQHEKQIQGALHYGAGVRSTSGYKLVHYVYKLPLDLPLNQTTMIRELSVAAPR